METKIVYLFLSHTTAGPEWHAKNCIIAASLARATRVYAIYAKQKLHTHTRRRHVNELDSTVLRAKRSITLNKQMEFYKRIKVER